MISLTLLTSHWKNKNILTSKISQAQADDSWSNPHLAFLSFLLKTRVEITEKHKQNAFSFVRHLVKITTVQVVKFIRFVLSLLQGFCLGYKE